MTKVRKSPAALVFCAAVVCLLTLGAPAAWADTISGTDFTATLTQNGSNVDVVVTASAGNSLKTGNGSDVFFDFSVTAAQITNLAADGGTYTGLTFTFATNQTIDSLGTFGSDIQHISGGNMPSNVSSVASYSFTVTGVTLAQLETQNTDGNSWGTHICTAPETGCATFTFFSAGPQGQVPEPASMGLLGTALLGAYALLRRKLLA